MSGEQIKPGYKRTEVGVIPEDWEVKKFGEFASPRRERIDPRKSAPIHFCIELEHVDQSSGRLLGSTQAGKEASLKTAFQKNDVLFGKLRAYLRKHWLADRSGACSTEIWALHANQRLATPGYLYQSVSADTFIEAASYSYGTHMPRSDWNVVKDSEFPLPPLSEQRAIATALSDVDALLTKLDQLIAKKRDLKQATMQQLLTGQIRLPGFSEKWEVKTLGDVVEKIVGGGTPSRSNSVYWGNEIPWVTVKDFATFHPRQAQESITRVGLNSSASNLIPAGTLITSTRMALGKAVIYEVDVAINQDLKAIFLSPSGSVKFLHYWFEHNAAKIDDLGSGSTVKGISISDLKRLPFPVMALTEQNAIATVLSDMDAELSALEARRDKTRALKQGMMQELLTGRIRLV